MPSTYTLISSNVLSSSAASVTFSAIPATYTDLVLRFSARSATGTGQVSGLEITFNNDVAGNYAGRYIAGDGASATSGSYSATNPGSATYVNGNASTASTFASCEIYIPNYAGSTNKPYSASMNQEANSTTAYLRTYAELWTNTAAITEIKLNLSAQNLAAGSSFYLYGIKNS